MNTRPFFLHASLRLPLCSLLLAIGAALPASAQNADPLVVLQSHEQRPWSLPADLERIAIANPDVADVVTLKKRGEVLLVGKSPGTTTLLLWQRGKSEPQRIQVDVRSAVQDALLGPGASAVTVQDGQALLAGSTESLLLHEQARKAATAATAGKGTINDVSTISSGGMVQVEVRVVEFNKTTLKQLGLQFSNGNGGFSYGFATTGAASLPGADTGTTSALSSAFNLVAKSVPGNWNANLNLLASNGMARVLAEPTLVALSGQSASFLAGGELPILEPQGLGTTTITYKPFGIGLTVTPTVLAPDRIALKVAPEASDLDWNNGIVLNGTQVPAISTRRADTTVELGDGESFVIGGLISSQVNSTVNKIPLLGDLPIIGSFFRNLDYQRQDKELVIVVTPRLVRPLARGTEITLPGERESQPKLPVWGAWLLHPAGSDALPGFSR